MKWERPVLAGQGWAGEMAAMKPVIQLQRTGCGIASVATVAGVRYREVQRAANQLGIYAEDERLWSETGYVRRLLQHYGIRAAQTEARFVSWPTLPDLALLAIKWHKVGGRAFWHWVVFWRGPNGPLVLDSKRALRTNIRTDFGRMRPKWFIAMKRPRAIVSEFVSRGGTVVDYPENAYVVLMNYPARLLPNQTGMQTLSLTRSPRRR